VNKIDNENHIDHEVRIRLLEKIAESIDKRFEHLENKIDSQFKWTIGVMITMFGGIIITKMI
jgi:chaperonin cofactor prefoldin